MDFSNTVRSEMTIRGKHAWYVVERLANEKK